MTAHFMHRPLDTAILRRACVHLWSGAVSEAVTQAVVRAEAACTACCLHAAVHVSVAAIIKGFQLGRIYV